MNQQQLNPDNQLEIKDLTSALMSALGVKKSDEGDKIQTATIFLSKLYRKYSAQTGKKFNEIKLNRLNGLIYKVCKDPPTEEKDIELIFNLILSFLYNEGSSPIDQNSFASNTCIWIAKFIQQILATHLPSTAVLIIETILKQKTPTLMTADLFDKTISQSIYFKDKQISKEDEVNSNNKYIYRGFMSQYSIYDQVIKNLNTSLLFSNLYTNHQNKPQILKLFISFSRRFDIDNFQQIFVKTFIEKKSQTKQTLLAILTCLDSQFFTADDFNQILKLLLNSDERSLFYSIPIKSLKCQHRYLQILVQYIKPNIVDQLAQTFINEKEVNNYYLIYLINKSNQKLSEKFITLPLDSSVKLVTNRLAIICALSISHNPEIAHNKILQYFFDHQSGLNNKQKLDCLKMLHYSYLNAPRSHLFTYIIKHVPLTSLDQQSNFEFLPRDNYQKIQLDKNERQELSDFLSRYFGNSDQVFWIKIDLYAACGKQIPCMQDFKKVQKIFQAPIDQIVANLQSVQQHLLQVVLMGINNKLSEQFVVNQNGLNQIILWGLEIYKKQEKKFKGLVESQLKKNNAQYLLELVLQMFYYNLDQNSDVQFDESLKHITNLEISQKLNGLNFSQYFMATQGEKNEHQSSLLRSKNILIELKKLIKVLKNDSKTQNRKELKTLVSQQLGQLRALRIIKLLSLVPQQKLKNTQKLKLITQKLLKSIKPQFENFKQLSTRSNNVNINYVPIYQSLQFLLKTNYQATIRFLAQLLKSSQVKIQQKDRGKKNKRKTDQSKQKNIESTIQNIDLCFKGDPNLLETYKDIICIIQQIKNSPNNQDLGEELIKWISKIKIFHKQEYSEWKQKVANYIKLWEAIETVVIGAISLNQIERHFLMIIDLLNTLYEKHRQQQGFLEIEKKLLNGLYILYLMAAKKVDKDKMQNEQQTSIPKQRLNEIIANNQLSLMVTPHTYYCYDCSKTICHQCAEIIHKQHDKSYTGIKSYDECHKGGTLNSNQQQSERRKEKEINKLIKEGYIREVMNRERQRERQNLETLIQIGSYQKLSPEEIDKIYRRASEKDRGTFIQSEPLPQLEQEMEKKKEQSQQGVDNIQIKSCSEKQFLIRSSNLVIKSKKPTPTLQHIYSYKKQKCSKLNVNPLFMLLIRQLKSFNFYTPNVLKDLEQKSSSVIFQAETSMEKCSLFRNDVFKNNRNLSYFGNVQNNSNPNQLNYRKNLITINDKYVSIVSTNSANGQNSHTVYHIDTRIVKTKFLKKTAQMRYKQMQQFQSFQPVPIRINEPQNQMNQIALSSFHSSFIAHVLQRKIIFQNVVKDPSTKLSISDIFRTQRNQSKGENQITKFEWFKTERLKNYYTCLTNQIKIGKLVKKQILHMHSISLPNKVIKDYSIVALGGKTIIATILDSEGKLYRAKFEISKIVPKFLQHQVNFQSVDLITSITCQASFIFCVTSNGKIIVMNLNEQNNFVTEPITYPIIESLKTHQIANSNIKVKQISKIAKLKFVCRSRNQLHLSCILLKETAGDFRKSGFFTLINLNINVKKSKSKITLFNDFGTVDSYDCLAMNDKQYLFVCLQDDGQVWLTKHHIQSKNSSNFYDFEFKASLNSVNYYAEQISRLGLFNQIQFYNKQRRPTFKQHSKLEAQVKTNIGDSFIKFEVNQRNIRGDFPTGIQLQYNYSTQESNGVPSNLVFTFLGNTYRYQITSSRQIQIPFTVKQSLGLYLGLYQFKIDFLQGKTTNIKNVILYGVKWTERSPYLEALSNLCKMMYVYCGSKQTVIQNGLQNYFYNEQKQDLNSFNLNELQNYFKKKKFKLQQQNLLMKLELLRQSIQENKADDTSLFQCYQSIRNHVMPNCDEKKELVISVKKLSNKFTASAKDENVFKLGHALNDKTQLDLYNIFQIYKTFRMERNIDSYQDLINSLCNMLNSHTLNVFIVFSIHPEMLKSIARFFKRVISKYRQYFSAKDHGLDKQQKLKLTKMCNSMMRILVENYQLQKNRDNKTNCEYQFLKILQGIFCLKNKQVHRQIKLNPFQFLQSTFQQKVYNHRNPPLNYLKIDEVNIYEPARMIEQSQMIAEEDKPKIEENQPAQQNQSGAINNQNGQIEVARENEIDYSESCEEHKQQEQQNRQMEQYQYAEELQGQGNVNVQKIPDEDSQCLQNEADDERSEMSELNPLQMNTKKVYEYLFNCCTSKMAEQQIKFCYYQICENLLLQIFSTSLSNPHRHKYLTNKNLVFYVGLVFNILQIVQKKIDNLFGNSGHVDFSHPYITKTIFSLVSAIDSKIDSVPHSVLYLPVNTIIANNPKNKSASHKSLFGKCVNEYYRLNMPNSKLLTFMRSSAWHPQTFKPSITLSSVLKLEYFDVENPIYQIKFVGNMYLNLRSIGIESIALYKQEIKENILKAVVKYNLRVYRNIMILENWIQDLEQTKINVAFEQLKNSSLVESSLRTMIKSLSKDINSFVNLINKSQGRLNELESLLGSSGSTDELIMEILDSYYNYDQKN